MKRRITVFFVFLLAVSLCGALIWFNFFRDKMIANFFATMQPPPQTVSDTPVVSKEWTPSIPAIGTARAINGVELAVQIAGVVKAINIVPNKRFKQGDVLVQLEDSVERADLVDAQATLKLSEANLDRSSNLQEKGYTPQSTYDQAFAQAASARARVNRLQAVIDQKSLDAPFDGVAGISRVDIGQYLQAGSVVTTFQDLDSMKVDFKVPEAMADKLKIGTPVVFGLTEDAFPFKGQILGTDPRVDPQTRMISVQAVLKDNKDEAVLPGQFLQVRVMLPVEKNVITVPQTAVVSSLYGDYVYVVETEKKDDKERQIVRQHFVKVGRREGGQSEILSGVEPGQTVVISGQNKLQPGGAVKINNTIDVSKATLSQ